MATTPETLESITTRGAGQQFQPALSDEFASRALARADRLETFVPGITATQFAVVLLLAAVYLATSFFALHHTDLWAHLAYGREMVRSGELLTAEPFGIEAATEKFTNVPWLAQIAGYQIYAFAGPTGLRLLHAVAATWAVAFLLLAARSRNVSWPWAIVAAAAAYVLSLTVVGVIRPQLAGMVAMPLVLLAVGRIERHRDPLYWLPPVFLLWSNLHGSFVLGIFVIFVTLFDSVMTARRKGEATSNLKPQASRLRSALAAPVNRRFALLAALCLIGTLINPLGPGLWVAVLGFSGQSNLADIVEWRPLILKSLGGAMFFTTLLITAVLLRLSPRRVRLSEVVLLLAFGAATLLSMRFIAWWGLVWPWVVVPHAMATARAKWGRSAVAAPDVQPMRTLIAVAAMFLALVWAPPSHALLADRPLTDAAAANSETPILLAEEINQRQFAGKAFVSLDWSDYLLWSNQGRVQPLVYSHVHLIDPQAWSNYRSIQSGQAGWFGIAEQEGLRYLVLRRHDPIARVVASHPRTVIRYQDQQSLVVELLPAEEPVAEEASDRRQEPPDSQSRANARDTSTGSSR